MSDYIIIIIIIGGLALCQRLSLPKLPIGVGMDLLSATSELISSRSNMSRGRWVLNVTQRVQCNTNYQSLKAVVTK